MIFDWNEHYKNGGKSGEPEDYNISRSWKKDIISKYCNIKIDSIIDIGCGDLQFWANELPTHYTGIDLSQTIVERNKLLHPESNFIASNAANQLDISSDIVMCFDMLWHIIDDDDYVKILSNIKKYSNKYIILYTWNSNVFDKGIVYRLFTSLVNLKHGKSLSFKQIDGDGGYQKYRDFLKIVTPIFKPEFRLVDTYTNEHWREGTMYIFKRDDHL